METLSRTPWLNGGDLRDELRRASCDHQAMPLNHVALTVSDRERSAASYAEHFGLTQRIHDESTC